ncbi:RING finger protein [Mycena venus]|uniref:RING finger protein n=1 Tax=Mycena venus TaxID=2733690 RepID=A0A8H7CUA2_9AGAR|nr:RING finger protein [Mycena venus]
MTRGKAEQTPAMVPTRTLQTRATSDEVCHNFLNNRCIWGDRCHRIHIVRPPPECQPTPSKTPLDSDSPPSKATVAAAGEVVVKLPNPRFQAQMPLDRLNSQNSCFIDSITPVVRLRRSDSGCPPGNPSQNHAPSMLHNAGDVAWDEGMNFWGYKTDETSWISNSAEKENSSQTIAPGKCNRNEGLFYDEVTNFWGFKTDENSWGIVSGSLSSEGSFMSESSLSAETVSSQFSSSPNGSQTEIKHPPPPYPQTCRNWLMDRCTLNYNCKYVHGDLNYDYNLPVRDPLPLNRRTCRDWMQNRCNFGNRCKYLHGYWDGSNVLPVPVPVSVPVRVESGFGLSDLPLSSIQNQDQNHSQTETEIVKISPPPPPPPEQQQQPRQTCRDWVNNCCAYGNRCKYFHGHGYGDVNDESSDPPPPSSIQTQSRDSETETETGSIRIPPLPLAPAPALQPGVCRAWLMGRCGFGERCRYLHISRESSDPPSSHPQIPPPSNREICRNYLNNRCIYGDRCIHIHVPKDVNNVLSVSVSVPVSDPPPSTSVQNRPQTEASKILPLPNRETCRKWLNNRCPNGDRCIRVHGQVNNALQSEPPLSITVHDHTKVKVGPGFEIYDVTTGVETPWIILSNIPARAKADAIEQFLSPFGSVLDVQLPATPAKDVMTVKARFAGHGDAIQASNALDGSTFLKTRISVRVPVNSRSGIASIQDCTVRIQWEAPQRVAYGAKGQSGDYYVYAAVHVGLPSIGIVTVKFTNLPPTASEDFMQRFAAPEDIMWERPNYTALAPAIDGIKRILRNLGNFLELEVLPPPYSNGLIRAWATFSSSTAAQAGAGILHGRKPVFTGKTRISARHVQSLAYHLSFDNYSKDVRLIDSLRESISRSGIMMTVSTRRLPSSMLVRLSAQGVKPLGWLKAEFEKISRGEILRRDGVAVWDFFFARPDGIDYLRGVEAKEPNVRIEADKVRRILKVFGTPAGRAAVRTILLQKMSDLKAEQVRVIRVPGRVVGAFIATQLSQLCEKFGKENVFVDIWERAITLRGGNELYEAGVEAVHQAQQSPLAQRPYAQDVTECPVCFNEVVSPISLRCGHKWCRTCLAQYLLAALDNRHFPLKCLGDEAKCTEPISLSTARTVLQPNEFNSVVEASISAYVHANAKEFHYCPSPDCMQIYRTGPKGTVVQCPSCLLRICSHCHAEAHDGLACAEQDGDKLFKEWAASHDVKNCPGCAIPIERDEGCHHVTCIQCQTHICWVCLQTFPKGEGVYKHMREEHGGIGLGEHD